MLRRLIESTGEIGQKLTSLRRASLSVRRAVVRLDLDARASSHILEIGGL
jgi:hypothetical protein